VVAVQAAFGAGSVMPTLGLWQRQQLGWSTLSVVFMIGPSQLQGLKI
jgi:hypothetical protein